MSKKQLIWLDCDPGHDDFFAIILAGLHPDSELLGVSTVGGNQTVDKVTKNALNTLHLIGLDEVPCCRGQEHALMSKTVACPEIHGDSGLDLHGDVSFPDHPLVPVSNHWLEYMAKRIMNAHQRVTLIATGRLTNIALLLQAFPQVMRNIDHISIMGGAMRGGNTHPVAEFNIQGDPEAAQIVFNCGSPHSSLHQLPKEELDLIEDGMLSVPIRLVTLETTHTVIATQDVLKMLLDACQESLKESGKDDSKFYPILQALFMFFANSYKGIFGFESGPPLHDPAAVYFSLAPEDFEYKHYRVDVECSGIHSRGQTVVDIWSQTNRLPNVFVATKLNVNAFWNTMKYALSRAAKQCSYTLKN